VQVSYDEGVAIHIGPESCAVAREGFGEALTGGAHRPAIEPRKIPILGADAVQMAEGNTFGRVIASARTTRRGQRPWHVQTLLLHGNREISRRPFGNSRRSASGSRVTGGLYARWKY
jgi:hypothetical protein